MTNSKVAVDHRGAESALDPDRLWIRIPRLAVGTLVLAAVAYNTWLAAIGDGSVLEQFSLFTIEANFVFALALILSALVPSAILPRWWDHLRGALTFYLVMTGIVYAVLVAPPGEFWRWDIEWRNLVMHRVAPLFAVADWLIVSMRTRAGWARPLAWLIFPVAYLVYSWVRGAVTGWYPYEFLDPTLPGGWAAVLQMTAIVLVAFLAFAVVVHVAGNLRARSLSPSKGP